MQRFAQLAALEDTNVLSAVELARAAQGQRCAKLQPPPVIGCHVADTQPEPEPEPEPELEPPGALWSSEQIAVPVGPAIGFMSPGAGCRDEVCGYVGVSSGGPACKFDHLVDCPTLACSRVRVRPSRDVFALGLQTCRRWRRASLDRVSSHCFGSSSERQLYRPRLVQ